MAEVAALTNNEIELDDPCVPTIRDVDVAEIKRIAEHLAYREELMLDKQQWRDAEDRIRALEYVQEAKKAWIDSATKTKESIEAAKQDDEQGKSKLIVLETIAEAIHPAHIESMKNTRLRWEYLEETIKTSNLLLSAIALRVAEPMKEAIATARATKSILHELRAVGTRNDAQWILKVDGIFAAKGAHKLVMREAFQRVHASQGLDSLLTESQLGAVNAKALELAGRTTKMTKLMDALTSKTGRNIRLAVVAVVLVTIEVIDAACDGGPTAAALAAINSVASAGAGMIAGVAVESWVIGTSTGWAVTALGCAAGAIVGFGVGAAVGFFIDAFIQIMCAIFTPPEQQAWREYMAEPIVYRVFIET
ncbi:hypothetical protein HMN09_01395700 [Mycena chlorophos]|uniref:Uncharacterized protein n=1 Tax=Mycena chlorophos TaxID=658473 RepID=A0A8H6RZC0_MYCCL|nr:hypothetical protein HMN09_01395700 [Mycena chlorophos]